MNLEIEMYEDRTYEKLLETYMRTCIRICLCGTY